MDAANGEEENNNEANSSSWWGTWPSWLQTAKEKSSTALELMKRDLAEFGHVVQTDAVAAVSSTAAALKETLSVDTAGAVADKARQSITSVFETISDVFVPPLKEIEDSELMIIKDSVPVVMDWWQSQLYLIRKDPKTFCHEPEGPPEMYENWLESFDLSKHQEEMTQSMLTSSDLRTFYDKLVPTSVSHLEFWQRYFYRVHLLRIAEAKRADLMRRAEKISINDIEWDKDIESKANSALESLEEQRFKDIVSSNEKHVKITSITAPKSNDSKSSSTKVLKQNTLEVEVTVEKNIDNKIETVTSTAQTEVASDKADNNTPLINVGDTSDVVSVPSSANSTDGSRSSPIELLGKEDSTGDEWEKDFDLEISESDLKKLGVSSQDSNKEEDEGWEKWQ